MSNQANNPELEEENTISIDLSELQEPKALELNTLAVSVSETQATASENETTATNFTPEQRKELKIALLKNLNNSTPNNTEETAATNLSPEQKKQVKLALLKNLSSPQSQKKDNPTESTTNNLPPEQQEVEEVEHVALNTLAVSLTDAEADAESGDTISRSLPKGAEYDVEHVALNTLAVSVTETEAAAEPSNDYDLDNLDDPTQATMPRPVYAFNADGEGDPNTTPQTNSPTPDTPEKKLPLVLLGSIALLLLVGILTLILTR